MQKQMRGASAETLTRVLESVDAATNPGGELASELFAAVAALDSTPALRRVLTDPSTDASAKQALAQNVFKTLGADALAVIGSAVTGRWSSPRDLPDGLELAGVTARVAAADAAGELDALETELFEVGRLVQGDAELRGVVADRTVPATAKGSLLTTLLTGKVAESTVALAVQAAVGRSGSFERAIDAFGDAAAARRNRLLAEVRVATPLDDMSATRLAAALGKKYGRDVHLNIVVDPSVVGGLSVSVGDEVVDGTMSTRLETARRQLAG